MLPDTLTEMFILLCLRLILRHITTRTANVTQLRILGSMNDLPEGIYSQFDQLCFIAYKGTEKEKIAFTSNDL